MNTRLAALAAASFACLQYAHAASDPRTARAGFIPDATPPVATAATVPPVPMANHLSEGFDDITTLTSNGWFMQNNSSPPGSTNWFQGTNVSGGGPFDAFDGAANAYIGANFNNTTGGTGTISNWLLTPVLDFGGSATLTFYTRKPTIGAGQTDYPDRLEVRLSTNGASADVGTDANAIGDFTTLALAVNPTLTAGGYPQTWTQYTVTGLPHSGSGRIAFRYYVTNGGPTGSNSDYIGIDRVTYDAGAPEYQIGGTVAGLAGSGLVLRLNGGNDLPIGADGGFTFPPYVVHGDSYEVTVATQPSSPNQTCTVSDGSGTASGTVTNVQVTCVTNTYSVGGHVSGLAGSGLVLHLDSGQDVPVSADGAFAFPAQLADGSAYVVGIGTQPSNPNQECTVANGSGSVAGADVTDIEVTCTTLAYFVGGSVSGLAGSGLVLHLDSGQDVPVSANGAFMFPDPLADGSAYAVTVGTQPSNPNQNCVVAGGSGTIAGGDATNVQVTCTVLSHSVGGHVVGLDGSGLVLQLNGADDLPIPADGAFTFSQPIQEGATYAVTVLTQPSGGLSYLCTLTNGSGTMGTTSVADVAVTCDFVFLDGFEAP